MRVTLFHKKHLRGFSLTEFAIVLGVIGIILAGIWALAGNMRNNTRQEKFSEMLTIIVGNIRGNYAGKAYFENTAIQKMMPILTQMNVFPGDAVYQNSNNNSVVDTPFGAIASSIYASSLYACGWKAQPNAAPNAKCDITTVSGTTNVPLFAIEALFSDATSCIGAVLRNSNSATLPGLVAVYVNGTQMPSPLPLATVALNSNCAKNGTKTVDFVYRLNP